MIPAYEKSRVASKRREANGEEARAGPGQARRGTLDGVRVEVDANHAPVGSRGVEDRLGVAARPERCIDVRPSRTAAEEIDDFPREHRPVQRLSSPSITLPGEYLRHAARVS